MKHNFLFSVALMMFLLIPEIMSQPEAALSDSTKRPLMNIVDYLKSKIEQERQELVMTEGEIIRYMDGLPPFSIYKDNFFITGIPLNKGINRETADAKFQLSIRHRLTSSRLPFDTFLYLTYTQKSFWDIYRDSAPFRDSNYNPGIGLGRYIIVDNRLTGAAFLHLEHESNGRDSLESRSTNWIGFSGKYFLTSNLAVGFKITIPFFTGKENSDLYDYRGTGYFNADLKSSNNKWWLSGTFSLIKSVKTINLKLTASYKISDRFNQYIFGELYSGTGDSLLDYKRKDLQLRAGICIKPDFYNLF
ncbi:phospholipase A [Proteiniphilum sp. UBA5463]|jgi:phospholipase A1|uniref:phospholipase A n=1 Tax=Proteiniphilum sp. UBA5463 TaxID=1947281 RepID=UPI00257C4991|nr:phospholipase A [Proteiniphilum sp. UBA5463]